MSESDSCVIKFARVVFSSDKKVAILPIEQIKVIKGNKYYSYSPKNKSDFIKLKYTYAAQLLEGDTVDEGQKQGDKSQKHNKQVKTVSILNLGGMYYVKVNNKTSMF